MNILEQKKRSHIAGYVISMWHIEQLVRAQSFDLEQVLKVLVAPDADPEEALAARSVYGGIVKRMGDQGLQKKGHLNEVMESIAELQFLHDTLIGANTDEAYLACYEKAKPGIKDLQALGDSTRVGEVEACFNGVYGVLLLRAKGTDISKDTQAAEKVIREMLDVLSDRFRAIRSFPDVSLN